MNNLKLLILFIFAIITVTYLNSVEFNFGEISIFNRVSNFPEKDYYIKTKIPIVFYFLNERNFTYEAKYQNYERENLSQQKVPTFEDFHNKKCSITVFKYIREIAISINDSSSLNWDICYNFEIEKKRLILEGRIKEVPSKEKERILIWKNELEEEIDKTNELPIPEIIPALIDQDLLKDVRNFHEALLFYLNNGIYSGLVIEDVIRKYSESYDIISNKHIYYFNKYVYDENIPPQQKKLLIQKYTDTLNNNIFVYQFKMMRISVLRLFPARTQKKENEIVYNEIHKSIERLLPHLEKFKQEKINLRKFINCLENWSTWHKDNLRMAYYFGFFYDYGSPKNYSAELLSDPEYGKLAELIEERKYKSKLFQNRLENIMKDACKTNERSIEEIKKTYLEESIIGL